MKNKTINHVVKMGYSLQEATLLVEKYWDQVAYLKLSREKALYITA